MHGLHSYGSELRYCEVNGIRIAETLMPAGLRLDEHSHDPGQICFVLEGEYRERIGHTDHALRPGAIQVHAPGERHANVFPSEDALTLLVSIERKRWLNVAGRRPFSSSALLSDLLHEVRQELTVGDVESHAALEGLSLLLLSRVSREARRDRRQEPEWLTDAVAFIDHHHARTISLATVAAAVGVHRATLAAAFRRFRATSVGEEIRAVRLRRATSLLHTPMPLDEIAVTCGFADQAHFGRLFKKARGTPPSTFRRRRPRSE